MESTVKYKIDRFWVGLVTAIFFSLLSYFVYAYAWSMMNDSNIKVFYEDVFIGFNGYFTSKVITICAITNVLFFYIGLRKNYLNFCKGILAVLILTIPVIVYFY